MTKRQRCSKAEWQNIIQQQKVSCLCTIAFFDNKGSSNNGVTQLRAQHDDCSISTIFDINDGNAHGANGENYICRGYLLG